VHFILDERDSEQNLSAFEDFRGDGADGGFKPVLPDLLVTFAGALNDPTGVTHTLTGFGLSPAQALSQLDGLTQSQAVMTATDQMFMYTTVAFVIAAAVVVVIKKKRKSNPGRRRRRNR